MNNRRLRALAAASAALIACWAHAQSIIGEIKTGSGSYSPITNSPFSSGAAIAVNVGALTQETTLRFYSSGGLADLGAVTITGSLNDPSARLSIIVAANQSNFPARPLDAITDEGSANVAGVTVTDTALRDNTRVAIAATGNLTGPITVGHVFRLQFNGTVSGTGGELLAAVTATATNNSVVTDTGEIDIDSQLPIFAEPLAFVRAAKKITGSLTATNGDIGAIRVGITTAQSEGLQADIKAPNGRIGSIYCAGVIGNPSATLPVKPAIEARDGILEIVSAEAPSSTILARDFFADVDAGKNSITPSFVDTAFEEGYLSLLRTGGDYTGSIKAANVVGFGGAQMHRGILINGVMTGSINIEHCVFGADIIAETFTQPIDIGVHLRGSVIATDPVNGQIPDIEVGYATGAEAETYALAFVRGFASVNLLPKDDAIALQDPSRWFGPNADANGVVRTATTGAFGAVDSIIRATSIGIVRLRSMSECSGSVLEDQFPAIYPPRVESPDIGSCTVEYFAAGAIWSGNINFGPDGNGGLQVNNDRSDDFALIGDADFICTGKQAVMWYTGCPRLEIADSAYGNIHVDALTAAQTIWIGAELGVSPLDPAFLLGDREDCRVPPELGVSSGYEPAACQNLGIFDGGLIENSPRDQVIRQSAYFVIGGVTVHDDNALEGQIIIDGDQAAPAALAGVGWQGQVIVAGAQVAGPAVLSQFSSIPEDIAPFYGHRSRDVGGNLGGGAVGQAPFHLHQLDSRPDHYVPDPMSAIEGATADLRVLESDFGTDAAKPVTIRSYGPIVPSDGQLTWNNAVEIECRPLDVDVTTSAACAWSPLVGAFKVHGPGDPGHTEPNALQLSRAPGVLVRAGVYRVIPREVVCFDVSDGNPPYVQWEESCTEPSAYVFVVAPDCSPQDGIDDRTPNAGQTPGGCAVNCHTVDFNGSGAITVQDLFDFLAAYFAGCTAALPPPSVCIRSADVNSSGTVTVQDIFDYLAGFFTCPN